MVTGKIYLESVDKADSERKLFKPNGINIHKPDQVDIRSATMHQTAEYKKKATYKEIKAYTPT